MRMAERRYGGVCDRCEKKMKPTGKTKKGPLRGAIGSADYRVVFERYECEECGRFRWEPADTEDEPS